MLRCSNSLDLVDFLIILAQTIRVSILVTHSYSSHPFLCVLDVI